MTMMMQGIRNAITKRAVLLLRPYESFKMEHVPSFASYPKMPVEGERKSFLLMQFID